jgi:hypothetical protein
MIEGGGIDNIHNVVEVLPHYGYTAFYELK